MLCLVFDVRCLVLFAFVFGCNISCLILLAQYMVYGLRDTAGQFVVWVRCCSTNIHIRIKKLKPFVQFYVFVSLPSILAFERVSANSTVCVSVLTVNTKLIFILWYTFVPVINMLSLLQQHTSFRFVSISSINTCANQRRIESKVTNKRNEKYFFFQC